MKSIIPIVCAVTAFIIMTDNQKVVSAKSIIVKRDDKYTTKYDNIDIDRILASKRLLTNYIKCLLDEGPCTAEGKELKSKFLQKFFLYCFSLFAEGNDVTINL